MLAMQSQVAQLFGVRGEGAVVLSSAAASTSLSVPACSGDVPRRCLVVGFLAGNKPFTITPPLAAYPDLCVSVSHDISLTHPLQAAFAKALPVGRLVRCIDPPVQARGKSWTKIYSSQAVSTGLD